jgi:hypothetical protein
MSRQRYRVGDWVEILSKEEILRTLDRSARLDGLPFMPEMFSFCGKRFQIFRRAHKTCDTVFPIRSRWMADAVLLGTDCDGAAHGGCQATCPIFWKTAWVKKVDGPHPVDASGAQPLNFVRRSGSTCAVPPTGACTEADVLAATRLSTHPQEGGPVYSCQATQLPYATTELNWWDIRQYIQDYLSGNVGLWPMVRSFIYAVYYNLSQAGLGLGKPMRWLYDALHPLWGGPRFPRTPGHIQSGQPTPKRALDLVAGELVRVKPHQEILTTLNTESKNRGMYWDAELVPYCGQTFRVLKRVEQILDEKTGQMLKLKGEAVILEGVYCQARYSCKRFFCPRALYPFWREAWLDRAGEPRHSRSTNVMSGAESRSSERVAG